ncbi:hypothetical protein [Sphingopyxis sp.]|uniref:hypothetical protein n=1 Tax=Sphingopyxis sp. TaxID=1908224 RepID=UPI002FCBEB75
MYAPDSPIQDVSFGTALKISLDNYYDLLKAQVGGLATEEYLQLKLVADTIDLSDKKASEGGYIWWSYYNLLRRSDLAIEPSPVSGEVATGLTTLTDVYGRFLRKLRTFAVVAVLSPADQLRLADLDKITDARKYEARQLAIRETSEWTQYAQAMGYEIGDRNAYVQWSSSFGYRRDIEAKMQAIRIAEVEKRTILDRTFPEPSDREIIDAEFAYSDPAVRLRYPIHPDHLYDDGDRFNLNYLAILPLGSTALFDDRHVASPDKSLATIKTGGAGAFDATFDRSTQESKSIETDWKASGSGGWSFIRVRANASQHTEIQEDFRKATSIQLGAKAAFRVNMSFPTWFRPLLFTHKRVRENPHDFAEFFGPKGSLLYYPTALIMVRGFSTKFKSSQKWTYDYKSSFSASGGGGFRSFGINFGGSGSYSKNVKEHKVDQSDTTLTITDDDATLRFVGFAVKKVTVFEDSVKALVAPVLADFAAILTEE